MADTPTPDEDAAYKRRRAARKPLLVDLALQGGGSHGAFTWGALDRLLDEEWMIVEAISGTSAGARAPAPRWRTSGARCRAPPPSARSSAARST